MAVEIEKKYRIDAERREAVESALAEFGAEYIGAEFEENTIYGGGRLDDDRAILRLRRTGSCTVLTYKRRIRSDLAVKHQIEHETVVSDAAEAEKIIEFLGFIPRLVYEKRRRTWRLRSVEVVIDELPFGLFMEIEGSITGIAEAEMLLGADEFEVVHETYPALTWNFGTELDGRVEARFAQDDQNL